MAKKTPLVLSGAQLQQLQAADYINTGIPYWMHKNRVLNGDFNVWQRGTALSTITTSGTYYPDQWRVDFDGTGANLSIQQQTFTLGQTAVPDNPKYYCECSVSIGATGQTLLAMDQRIESALTFAGQTATVSFYAKADTTRTLSVRIDRGYGSGGSPTSTDVGIAGGSQSFSLTTSWQKFTATFSIPSISGKTLGTNNNDWLSLVFLFPVNSGFTIDIAHVQFEQGGNATQFEYRHIQHELLMCQRYFEAIVPGSGYGPLAGGGWVGQSGATYLAQVFARYSPKRTLPTVSFPDPVGNYYLNLASGANALASIAAVGGGSVSQWQLACQTSPALTSTQAGQACALQCNNTDTARIWVSAEL
jgi:hypothetical protein